MLFGVNSNVKAAFERANESAQPHALGTVVLQQLQKQTGQITYLKCLIVAKIDLVADYKKSNQSPNLSSYFREWLNWSRLSRREAFSGRPVVVVIAGYIRRWHPSRHAARAG